MKKEKQPKTGPQTERDVAGLGCVIFYLLLGAAIIFGPSSDGSPNSPSMTIIIVWLILTPAVWVFGHLFVAWIQQATRDRLRRDARLRGIDFVDPEEAQYQEWKRLHEEALLNKDSTES